MSFWNPSQPNEYSMRCKTGIVEELYTTNPETGTLDRIYAGGGGAGVLILTPKSLTSLPFWIPIFYRPIHHASKKPSFSHQFPFDTIVGCSLHLCPLRSTIGRPAKVGTLSLQFIVHDNIPLYISHLCISHFPTISPFHGRHWKVVFFFEVRIPAPYPSLLSNTDGLSYST